MDDKLQIMKDKVSVLNRAAKAYYRENREVMSNLEYDRLYDELEELERETGIVLSNSPTVRVGYELAGSLPKERHDKAMLSLDKTKDVAVLKEWLGQQRGLLSWKLDGLTIVLTYSKGRLVKAVTRGNGEVGEVVTNNARVFVNIPLNIPFQGGLILRGEAVIGYEDFHKLNSRLTEVEAKYKNPRNLCSGSVRQLNNRITAERSVHFFAFGLVRAEDMDFANSRKAQLDWLKGQGFDVVPYKEVDSSNIEECVDRFAGEVEGYDFPSDGLVLIYDDIQYGEGLGATAKFPRDAIAFKWRDEIKETTLLEVEWSASRTGLINPIAIFEPVELEGTTVSRASVHNISIMEGLELGIGDEIRVYKANMIIPQVAENLTKSGTVRIPEDCPVCSEHTSIRQESGVKVLYCTNEECPAKQVKAYTHFVSRDAMGVDGLSEATIEKLLSKGLIKELADIFHIEKHEEQVVKMEGFGEKSYRNLVNAVNKARTTNTVRLLYSLGIPNVGLSNAKAICKHFKYDWKSMQSASYEDLTQIYGIGDVMAEAYVKFFSNEKNIQAIDDILAEIRFEEAEMTSGDQLFENLTFVITGSVARYKNRNELKAVIEGKGGKVTDSVTAKTDFLINNDSLSNSSKNKKAKELDIPIITEEQFAGWLESGREQE
ncbi:MAG: NAD-dependent DNA ligase LigA [Anaerovoracaceae bacterium]